MCLEKCSSDKEREQMDLIQAHIVSMMVGNDDNDAATAPNDMSSDNSYVLWGYEKYPDFAIGPQKIKQESRMAHKLFWLIFGRSSAPI